MAGRGTLERQRELYVVCRAPASTRSLRTTQAGSGDCPFRDPSSARASRVRTSSPASRREGWCSKGGLAPPRRCQAPVVLRNRDLRDDLLLVVVRVRAVVV